MEPNENKDLTFEKLKIHDRLKGVEGGMKIMSSDISRMKQTLFGSETERGFVHDFNDFKKVCDKILVAVWRLVWTGLVAIIVSIAPKIIEFLYFLNHKGG